MGKMRLNVKLTIRPFVVNKEEHSVTFSQSYFTIWAPGGWEQPAFPAKSVSVGGVLAELDIHLTSPFAIS